MSSFNPRTYIRYDLFNMMQRKIIPSFNPRTYIRYDHFGLDWEHHRHSFNPRTYIRYDYSLTHFAMVRIVSIHVPI